MVIQLRNSQHVHFVSPCTKCHYIYKKLTCFSFILVSLQDIQLRKAFRSSQAFDQQVVSRDTMPKAMLEAYMACDKPPPLDKLNPYRYVNFTSTFCLL